MSKSLSSLVVVVMGIACGGTSTTFDDSSGGMSQGGMSHAGRSGAGAAGKATGGHVGTGGSIEGMGGSAGNDAGGSISIGGSIVSAGSGGVGVGGTGTVDARCPAQRQVGACSADDVGVTCQYDVIGCLCYPSPLANFYQCQRVDPSCPNSGGSGGMSGAAAASPGAGGISTKVALPPRQICSCVNGMWSCSFGF